MRSRKRKSAYSDFEGHGGGGMRVLRSLAALLVLGLVCFGVGFFIVARFVPQEPGNASNARSQSAPPSPETNARPSTSPPAPMPSQLSAPAVSTAAGPTQRPGRVDASVPGPSIDPVPAPNVQNPSAPESPAPQNDSAAAPDGGSAASGNDTTAVTPRRRHATKKETDAVQLPTAPPAASDGSSGPDSTTTSVPSTAPTAPATGDSSPSTGAPPTRPAPSTPKRSAFYHVQTGVFATREAADREADRVRGKGFEAAVQTIERDGRTLYRVQHALYRRRANAEEAKQRLAKAGISATVSTIP